MLTDAVLHSAEESTTRRFLTSSTWYVHHHHWHGLWTSTLPVVKAVITGITNSSTLILCSVCSCLDHCEDPYADSPFLLQTKRIKEILPKYMINDYLCTPSRQTTDKALAEAAGKPVLELQQDSAAYASYSQKVTSRNALHAQRAGVHMMLHLACSHILATLQEDHAAWQTAAFPALPRQGGDHRWPPD